MPWGTLLGDRIQKGYLVGVKVSYHIVEDDSAVADALEALLSGAGHQTHVYNTAEDFIAAGPPARGDTVVVDLGLPGISGASLVRWLSALAEPPRVVVISGKSAHTIARETKNLSLSVLRKPPAADWLSAIAG